jgi:hypothetical protein
MRRRLLPAGIGPNQPPSSSGPSRTTFLYWAGTVDAAFVAVEGLQLAVWGKRDARIRGSQFVMATPVLIYGIDFLRDDPSDWQSWVLTTVSAALVVDGLWPILSTRFGGDTESDDATSRSFDVSPTVLAKWDDGALAPGLMLSGAF